MNTKFTLKGAAFARGSTVYWVWITPSQISKFHSRDESAFKSMAEDDKGGTFSNPAYVTILFKPPLAETTIADNGILDDPGFIARPFNTLFMEFQRSGAPDGARTQYIKIDKTAGFPEVEL